jgi:multiple sugar transport system permease protein
MAGDSAAFRAGRVHGFYPGFHLRLERVFLRAMLIMSEKARQTLPVGIALFQGQYTMPWGEIAAASTVATLPLVIMVLLFQKRIVSGLSAGAIKG